MSVEKPHLPEWSVWKDQIYGITFEPVVMVYNKQRMPAADVPKTRADLFTMWDAGWKIFLEALDGLSEADLTKTVTIRGEAHSVMQAINRQTAHYSCHIGQIILLAKHFAGDGWKSISVPKKGSGQFTADVKAGNKSQR